MDQELLRALDVLRELPDRVGVRVRDLHALARDSLRLHPEVRVLEHLRVGVLGRAVRRDRVLDPARHAGREIAIVRGVVPGEHLGGHTLFEQRLHGLQALAHLLRVEQDVPALPVRLLSPVTEEESTQEEVRVVAVREGEAGRMSLGLQGPRRDSCRLPGVRRLQTFLVEQVLAVQHRRADVEVRHRVPLALGERDGGRRRDPAAPFLADPVGDVTDLDQVLVVETREDRADEVDQVVPGARGEFRGDPGRQLEVRNPVDPHLDAVRIAPLLHEVVEPRVVRGNEVAPLKNAERRALELSGRLSRVQHRQERCAGDAGSGRFEELTACVHRGLLVRGGSGD